MQYTPPAYDDFGDPLHPGQDLPMEYWPFLGMPDFCGIHCANDPPPDLIAAHFRKADAEFAQHVQDAQVFDFGTECAPDAGARLPYMLELFARQFVDTPYRTVIYRMGTGMDRRSYVVDRLVLAIPNYGPHYRVAVYYRKPPPEGGWALLGTAFYAFTMQDDWKVEPDEPRGRMEWMPSRAVYEGKITMNEDPSGRDTRHPNVDPIAKSGLHQFLTCALVLATDGVPRRVQKASAFINAERKRKGKPRVPTVTHIDFTTYLAAVGRDPGHHASPVPHLRRGHIRRLQDGRRVWVRDCMVNLSADVEVDRRAKYIVDKKPDASPDTVH